jgi:hypothetical protein
MTRGPKRDKIGKELKRAFASLVSELDRIETRADLDRVARDLRKK